MFLRGGRKGAHATELINAGVSIKAVRRRLGHASTETTQLYALLDDKIAAAEIRAHAGTGTGVRAEGSLRPGAASLAAIEILLSANGWPPVPRRRIRRSFPSVAPAAM